MIDLSKLDDFVFQNLQNVSRKPNGGYHCRCPLCGDSKKSKIKKRLHIDFYKKADVFVFTCYNCGESGSIYHLYSLVKNVTSSIAQKELNTVQWNGEVLKRRLQPVQETIEIDKIEDEIKDYCKGWITRNSKVEGTIEKRLQKALIDFEVSRKVPVTCFATVEGPFKGRAIIPLYQDGVLKYFQGRALFGQEPKYLNPPVKKEGLILNKDNFERDKYIIVTEGLLDAYSVGNQGTAILHATISQKYIESLMPFTNAGVIFALDNDSTGVSKVKKYIKDKVFQNFRNVGIFFMPDEYKHLKDMNDLKVKTFIDDLYTFVLKNSYYPDNYLLSKIKFRKFS
jgi:hypothetical protein